jgi:hypothetical protein
VVSLASGSSSGNGIDRVARRSSSICPLKFLQALHIHRCTCVRADSIGDSSRSSRSEINRCTSLQFGIKLIGWFLVRGRAHCAAVYEVLALY